MFFFSFANSEFFVYSLKPFLYALLITYYSIIYIVNERTEPILLLFQTKQKDVLKCIIKQKN